METKSDEGSLSSAANILPAKTKQEETQQKEQKQKQKDSPRNLQDNVHTNVLGRDSCDSDLNRSNPMSSNLNSNGDCDDDDSKDSNTTTPSSTNRRFIRGQPKGTTVVTNRIRNSITSAGSLTRSTAYHQISSPSTDRPEFGDQADDNAEGQNSTSLDAATASCTNGKTTTGSTKNDLHNNRNSKRWWKDRLLGLSNSVDDGVDNYDDDNENVDKYNVNENSKENKMKTNKNRMTGKKTGRSKVANANYKCLSTATDSDIDTNAGTFVGGTIKEEDRVRENCSYFYRGTEENRTTPFSANAMRNISSRRSRIFSGREGAMFMSKYERLNQVFDHPRPRKKRHEERRRSSLNIDDGSNSNNDLFLDEEDPGSSSSCYVEHIPNPTNNVVMDATSLTNPHGVRSSLFYEHDGKMLMRLPRDRVRLVMDYDLVPGILSVEQWRNREDAERTALAGMTAMTDALTIEERERKRRHRRQRQSKQRRVRYRNEKKIEDQQNQKEKFDDENDGNRNENEGSEQKIVEEVDDPLKTEGGGQQPIEVVQEMKRQKLRQQQHRRLRNDYVNENHEHNNNNFDDDGSYDDEDDDEYLPESLPELNYVITVQDDLYRRIVEEMSAAAFPPHWGFFKCWNHESGRADIRLALIILFVVMLLLGIGSLEWPTD